MKILARRELKSPSARAVLVASQSPGDPLVSLTARYFPMYAEPDDCPEVRIRCKPAQLKEHWAEALRIMRAFVPEPLADNIAG